MGGRGWRDKGTGKLSVSLDKMIQSLGKFLCPQGEKSQLKHENKTSDGLKQGERAKKQGLVYGSATVS